MDKLLFYAIDNKVKSILFLLFITIISLMGYKDLGVDTRLSSLLNEQDSSKKIYDKFVDEFGSDNTALIYIKDKNLFTYDKLVRLEDLVYELEELPFVEKVDSLFSVKNIKNIDGFVESNKLIDGTPEEQEEIDQIKIDALNNPLVIKNLLSNDALVTTINVSIMKNDEDKQYSKYVYDTLEKLLNPLSNHYEEVFQIGSDRVSKEMKESLFNDLFSLGSLSMLTLLVLLFLFLRTKVAMIIPLFTSLLSIVITFGFMGWIGIEINILNAMLPTMIIVLGSTEDTHMISAFLDYYEKNKSALKELIIKKMLKKTGVALFLTSLTTVLGFGSNYFNDIALIKDFAITASLSLTINAIITILFVPILLSFFKFDTYSSKNSFLKYSEKLGNMLDNAHLKYFKTISIIVLIILVVFLVAAKDLKVNNDPLSYFHEEHSLVVDANKLHNDLSGMQTFYIAFDGENENYFKNSDNLKIVEKVKKYIDSNKNFDSAISFSDHMSLVNREMRESKEEYYKVPDKSDLISQYLLFFQRGDIEKYISSNFSKANIVVRHNISSSYDLKTILLEVNNNIKEIIKNNPELKVYITSENILINKAAENLLTGQLESLIFLVAVVFVLISLLFVSVKAGLVSLLPNIIPIILTFGTMRFLDIPINPGTIMVAVIAFGIALDDTIHLMTNFNNEARKNSDIKIAVSNTVRHQLVPVITTSISLAIGFLVLNYSSFTIVANFGLVAAIAMIYAMLTDLLVTPLLISKVRLVNLWDILALDIKQSVLQKCDLFKNMSIFQIKKVILLSKVNKVSEGEFIINKGDIGTDMFIILDGKVDVLINDNKTIVASLSEGDIIGEVGFVKKTERTASVLAKSDLSVLRLNSKDVYNSLKYYPHILAKLNSNINVILGQRLASVLDHIIKIKKENNE